MHKRGYIAVGLLIVTLMACVAASARGTYQTPEAFLKESFAGHPPSSQVIWITAEMQADITRILGHPAEQRRMHYWRAAGRSVWILEEIGKEEPITSGYVIQDGKIEKVTVLIYRESRGDEVRYPRWTNQFKGGRLNSNNDLDVAIDNISGASLSVQAMTRMARLALYLDSKNRDQK